ncbi:hypothetical protein RSOCI_03950 [Rhabdochlamydiaceae symbiont of Dictyostelium giganteum]
MTMRPYDFIETASLVALSPPKKTIQTHENLTIKRGPLTNRGLFLIHKF